MKTVKIVFPLLLSALVGCGGEDLGQDASSDLDVEAPEEQLETSTDALTSSSCTVTLRSCTTASTGVYPSCNHKLVVSVRGSAVTTTYRIYDVRNGVQVASGSVGAFRSTTRYLSGVYSRYKGRIDGGPGSKITLNAPIVICN